MRQTKGAIGNLLNRYKAVLKKCNLLNTFGSLAVASMLVMGGAGVAQAAHLNVMENNAEISGPFDSYTNTEDKTSAPAVVIGEGLTGITIKSGTTFSNNRNDAATFGGAVKALGQFNIEEGVTFSNNVAGENAYGGGALYIRLGDKGGHTITAPVTITSTQFINNKALNTTTNSGLGGAIALENGELVLTSVVFDSNSANDGGAIANWYDATDHEGYHSELTSSDTYYIGNSALNHGGAISFKDTAGTLKSSDDTYEDNDAAFGGAIFNGSANGVIDGSTFTGNKATAEQGAGGAIYNAAGGKIDIDDATFTGNTAALGGAINNAIADSKNNLAAGELSISGSTFENNQALGSQGGAIRNQGTITSIESTEFIGNSAHNGGAINNGTAGVITFISGSTFANNSASTAPLGSAVSYQGGAITNAGKIEVISDSYFTGNSTVGTGGAIANVAPQSSTGALPSIALANVDFTGNTAGESGGAIANMNGTVSLNQTIMTGNTAGVGGGIYNAESATVALTGDNTITSNTSAAGVADDIYTEGTVSVSDGETTVGAINVTETGSLNVSGAVDAPGSLEVTNSIQSTGNVTVSGYGSMSLEATAGDSNIATLNVAENGEFLTENTASSTTIGTLSTAGEVTLGSATTTIGSLDVTANSGSVTFANGNATVATLATDGTVRVGGAGLSASLTLTGDDIDVVVDSVVIDSLGTLSISNDQIQNIITTDWAVLNAGGTLTVTGLEGKLSAEELTQLKNDLFTDNSFEGLLDIGKTTVEVVESGDGHIDYSADLAGIKNNQLIDEIVDVDTTEAGDLHGSFGRVHVTDGTAESTITTQNTLQLAGTTNDNALAYADVDGEEVALDVNIGVAEGEPTAEASLILGDYSLPNSGTLGDIAMNATKSTLDVRGNGSPNAEFEVGTIIAKDNVENALVNVTGTSLTSGAIDLRGASEGGVVVDYGSLAVQDEEDTPAEITFNETNGGTLAVVNGSSLLAGDVTNVNTLTVDNSDAYTGDVIAVADAEGNAADIVVNNGSYYVDGSVSGDANIVVNGQSASMTANGNITADTVALGNSSSLSAFVNDDVEDTGNVTIKSAVSGQGTVYAEDTLTLTNSYTGAATDDLTLMADNKIAAQKESNYYDLKKADGGRLNLDAPLIAAGDIDATNITANKLYAQDVIVDGGALNLTEDTTLSAPASQLYSLTLENGASGTIDATLNLRQQNTGFVAVGTGADGEAGSSLSVRDIDLKGGMLLASSAWGQTSGNMAVKNLANGSIGVGQNAYMTLGTMDRTWLPNVADLSETGTTAVLGIYNSVTIAENEGIVVDGSLTGNDSSVAGSLGQAVNAAANTPTFADNSLLVVNGENVYGETAAITFAGANQGTLSVAEGAKLQITDVMEGQSYIVVDNVTLANDATELSGWQGEIETNTDMITVAGVTYDPENNRVVTQESKLEDAHKVFPDLSDEMANVVNDLYTTRTDADGKPGHYADTGSKDMGIRFLSRATDKGYLGGDHAAAASTIESAARIAFAGAVPQMTKMASDSATNSVVNRMGFANPENGAKAMNVDGKLVDDKALGLALWIAPLWSNQTGFGMEAGNLDYGYNANLGGISLGADYTWANNFRAGLMFNIGGGYAESAGGDLSETTNSMTFWGVGAYGGWKYENFAVMGDVSYTSTWNSVDQDVDSRMGMGDLEADIQASAISAGLRFEYKLETQYLDLIPHVGARYMSINTWGYDVETNGGTVLEGDGFQQNIWTFPVGITFSKELEMNNDWYFKPSVDFTVIPAAGDIKAKEDVRFTGMPYSTEIETQMMDYFTWQGGVGLEFGNDNMSVGVNYTLQAGQNSTGHGVFGMFRYEF